MNLPAYVAKCLAAVRVFARDVGHGLVQASRHGLVVLGATCLVLGVALVSPTEWRSSVEHHVYGWLHVRHGAPLIASFQIATSPKAQDIAPAADDLRGTDDPTTPADETPAAILRATAADPSDLTQPQAAVARWISRRYKVAPEPISRLVQEAWEVGKQAGVEPTLILAIMAIESSFNPFAQSSVGAQGLMQVMTKVHDKKYEAFGGAHAAFDPVTNLRVGVEVLKESIARGGSVYDGLRYYVGAANLPSDGGYAGKVLGEHQNLKKIAAGVVVPHTVRIVPVPAPSTKPRDAGEDAPARLDEARGPSLAGDAVRLSGLATDLTP